MVLRSYHNLINILLGVLSQDLLGVIRILSAKKWFSIEEYNIELRKFNYQSYEASDKPYEVPYSLKVTKLKGNAVSIWTHMRLFPFFIRQFIKDRDDLVLELGILLHEITERISANKFEEYEVQLLEERIVKFLDLRKALYEEFDVLGSPKPKTHFLSHYPDSIRLYGPPMSYWTARFESRHRIAKMSSESAKNYINISHTISTRQQLRLSSIYYHGMFPNNEMIISGKSTYKKELKLSGENEKFVFTHMCDGDFLCSEIEFRSQQYRPGQLVVLEVVSPDQLKMGLILSILVKENSAYLVVKYFFSERTELCYFKADILNAPLNIYDIKDLADYKPLVNHGSATEMFFTLHHGLSFSYP